MIPARALFLPLTRKEVGNELRTRKWIAVAGGINPSGDDYVFEWEDGEGNFGRCLIVKKPELRKKVDSLAGETVLITGYYPKGYEDKLEESLGVLIDIRKATEEDFEKYESLLASDRECLDAY